MLKRMFTRFSRIFKPRLVMVKHLSGQTFIVDKRCKVCVHPERAEIEKMLIQGISYEEICKKFNVSEASLSRHFRKHMPQLVLDKEEMDKIYEEHRVKQIDLQEEMLRLIDKLRDLFSKLERFDEMFFQYDGEKKIIRISPHAYVESVAERRQILEKIKDVLLVIDELKSEIKTEKDLSELLQKLKEAEK